MAAAVSRERIARLVELVRRVPTGENCQPWSFVWNGRKLSIFHDAERARNRINHDDYVSYFSLGFLIAGIEIAASSQGLKANVEWHPTKKINSCHWADVDFEEWQQPADELLAALPKRFTDRRLFKKGRLSDPVFSLVECDAGQFQNCKLYWRDTPTEDFLKYVCEAETFFWTNRPFHNDYTRWLRLTKREAVSSRDGLPWRALGVNYAVSRLLLICKSYRIQHFANKIGFVSTAKKLVKKQVLSSAAVGCITIASSNIDNLVEAGRLGMRTWLRLSNHAYGFHPMSLSSLFVHYAARGVADQIYPGLPSLGRKGSDALKAYFGYPTGEIPIWMFRTGLSAGFPSQPLTLRLETEEILKFEVEN